MTGHISGVSTCFHNVVKPGFIGIWCGAHQLDTVLQSEKMGVNLFYYKLIALISYLRRQQNIISAIRSKAPKSKILAGIRWVGSSNGSRRPKLRFICISTRNVRIVSPPMIGGFTLCSLLFSPILATSNFKCLQGHQVTVSMKRTHLDSLQTSLLRAVGGRGPLLESEAATLDGSE